MKTEIKVVPGKELSKDDLKIINLYRKKEFNSDSDILPAPDNQDWNKPYFLVKNESNQLLSFGRLHFLNIKFRNKIHPVLGIASVLSIVRKKGFGRMIIEKMKEFSGQKKITAIGFCDPEDSLFYKKCGLEVRKGMDRFVFPNGPKTSKPGNVIYFDSGDGLFQEIEKYPEEKVFSYKEEW